MQLTAVTWVHCIQAGPDEIAKQNAAKLRHTTNDMIEI